MIQGTNSRMASNLVCGTTPYFLSVAGQRPSGLSSEHKGQSLFLMSVPSIIQRAALEARNWEAKILRTASRQSLSNQAGDQFLPNPHRIQNRGKGPASVEPRFLGVRTPARVAVRSL